MKLIIVTLFALFISAARAESIKIHVNLSPTGSFDAVSEKVKGEAHKTKDGGVEASKITVLIQTLKTDIDLRDEHFWKHLDSKNHPKAVLTDVKGMNGKATGVLDLAGVKRPVNIDYKVDSSNLIAKFQVKNSDFKLQKVSYMGVGVEDIILIEATVPFK